MSFLNAALLGVVQGLTEFLPISSTAHLLLGARLLGYDDPGGAFTVMIQLGSILAVIWLYRAKVLDVVVGLPSRPEARRFAGLVLVGFVPALIAGAFFADFVKQVLYYSPSVIAAAFIAGGVVMLLVERFRPEPTVATVDDVSFGRAFAIGTAQVVAMIPGVSRSGATIVGGLMSGLTRTTAAEFSFFLSMPTMVAAFVHDFLDVRSHLTATRGAEIAVGFVCAFVAAALVVKPFLRFVGRAGFGPFAWYRISVGAALALAIAAGWL